MADFNEQIPQWEKEGIEPPEDRRTTIGWQFLNKPPASWFNWFWNKTYKALQELQQNATHKEDFNAHLADNATLTEKAHVEQGIVSATILSTAWTGSEAPYTQVVTATGVKAGDVSTVDIDLSNAIDYAEEQAIADEWAKIYRIVATDDDEITVYATEETTEDIEVTIKVVR